MMFGFLGLAVITGLTSGAIALITGLGAAAALAIYAGTGVLVLLAVMAQALLETMQEGRAATLDGGGILSPRPGKRS